MSVPIATSPGRSGFGPQLSLSYDSGAGNGPFGFGWSLSLPSITRKTDKGLPQYRDAEESDVYILSGAEDLVPLVKPDGTRFMDNTTAPGYIIHRYRPRIEGLFARIERWTSTATDEIHWRSITRDNVTTLYGKDNNSRIFDPGDPSPTNPKRIFSWLICESYDDKGNAIVYDYAEENDDNVDQSQANERNRVRTANRYLKRIKYGNRTPNRNVATWEATDPSQLSKDTWMFEVVFDYGEDHYAEVDPNSPPDQHRFVQASALPDLLLDAGARGWAVRPDPFSSHRAGFEVRTYRRCRRVLMFHHIPDLPTGQKGYDGLVRSTEFDYADLDYTQPVTIQDELAHQGSTRFASFIRRITQSGYVRDETQPVVVRDGVSYATYLKKSLPPLEFEYSKAAIQDQVREVDAASLENLSAGLDGSTYQWVDLHGEGISGILTEQAGAWFYKRNISPISERPLEFAPLQRVASKPNLTIAGGQAQFMDLAGDGQPDLVVLDGPMPGLYEHDDEEGWQPFRPFTSRLNRDTRDPNLKFIDLDGDGHADVLITEQDVFTWHPSLAEEGFGPAENVRQPLDEERGPRLVFADGTQSIYLADMCGDGLTDLVRIRNGEVCYWPNQGNGRFGAKVTMDNAPRFDHPDQFDQRRVRLADIDGSGTNDIVYLDRDGVRIYFNQSGNRLSEARRLDQFPRIDSVSSVMTADLLGNGTACLVWSSPLPADARRPLRYIDLMGGIKPHLLVKSVNNLGAETEVHYAPSIRFYLEDKRDGRPWVTRLPFPVHVVERVVTHDRISGNRFVTRYAYHHGYFDGVEREFRGFGMVEQWDTEEFAALRADGEAPTGTNIDDASHVPPVLTKTWFHTGVYDEVEEVSQQFAAEYYGAPKKNDPNYDAAFDAFFRALLPDTVIPANLTPEEEREACRALKGSMLRQEVYAQDGTDEAEHPYTVTEQNFTIRKLQPRGSNRHGVFFTHAREAINYRYERNPADPRISHALTLAVDNYGNVERAVTIGYPRRPVPDRQPEQNQTHMTLTVNRFSNRPSEQDWYRVGLPVETRSYEIVKPPQLGADSAEFFEFDTVETLVNTIFPVSENGPPIANTIFYENWDWRAGWDPSIEPGGPGASQLRLIECVRTLYRRNDLTGLLPLGDLESMALPGEVYKLAFTPGLLSQIYQRGAMNLLPDSASVLPANVVGEQVADRGGYVDLEGDGHWWIPSGRIFFDINADDKNPAATAPQELTEARRHFFLPRKFTDPFGHSGTVDYDQPHDLLITKTEDAVHNVVLAENDYRLLQPTLVTDPNGNQSDVMFDALGLVVGTAVMGKPDEDPRKGDLLDDDFQADLTQEQIDEFFEAIDPHDLAFNLLAHATTRIIYDFDRYQDTGQPVFAATLARETHFHDPGGAQTKIQISFSYSDGFGREIQKKIQAEPGPVVEGGPIVNPRWVGSGWTIFNNKGKPVRQYEPFFSRLPDRRHQFEFARTEGVSPILFYDPIERVVATLHPNHTYEKVVFDPWQQTTYDVNDTVLLDPGSDSDVSAFFTRLPDDDYLPSWHTLRTDPALALLEWPGDENMQRRANEGSAARKAAIHANTPTKANFDALGRPFLSIADNGVDENGQEQLYETRVELDIEGNQRAVIDARGRTVMTYDYDILGHRIHQVSMDAGARWLLNDVTGKPIRAWDSRDHSFRTEYDELRRPVRAYVIGADPENPNREILFERTEYGEGQPNDTQLNLRTRVFRQYDGAGVVTSMARNPLTDQDEAYDFKGNLLRGTRQLAVDYKATPDWAQDPLPALEGETFTSSTIYDALNRPVALTTPDNSVIRPAYNEANLLNAIDVNLRGARENDQPVWTSFVTNIDYNARGQRTLIEYGNGVNTEYEYDEDTFRLIHLNTTRGNNFPADERVVQDLHYTYDPVGNITSIRDDAQQTIFFNGEVVLPHCHYTYDAIYRLIEARGREHIGQLGQPQTTWNDEFRVNRQHPQNGQAMRNYTERYVYDGVGNLENLIHQAVNGGWTRAYACNEPSLIEPEKPNNRLTSTTVHPNGNQPLVEPYTHDAHGNMIGMPHLPLMRWDYKDQLQATSQQVVNNGGTPEITYYVYDATGQRVRKVTEHAAQNDNAPRKKEERIYLGGFEIHRQSNGNGNTVTLERETLHIMDDKQRIALVETKTVDTEATMFTPTPLIRYQFGNHLGSTSLELDDHAQIISYEEYYPYGSTSYQAVRSGVEINPKRYRYTGKERDEESGLSYYGARYYAPWLGRWTSIDPAGPVDGTNLFRFSHDAPTRWVDPQGMQSQDRDYGPPPSRMRANFANFSTLMRERRTRERRRAEVEAMRPQIEAEADAYYRSQAYADQLNHFRLRPDQMWHDAETLRRNEVYWNPDRNRWESSHRRQEPNDPSARAIYNERLELRGIATEAGNRAGTAMLGIGTLTITEAEGAFAEAEEATTANPVRSAPRSGGGRIGPAYQTFEEIEAAIQAGEIRERAHILGVIVKDPNGTIIGRWYEVSELSVGVEEARLLGHTEQKALFRISEMGLERGSTVEFIGSLQPCNLPQGCSSAMTNFAQEHGIDIRYRHVYGEEGTTIHEFRASEGRITKKMQETWQRLGH